MRKWVTALAALVALSALVVGAVLVFLLARRPEHSSSPPAPAAVVPVDKQDPTPQQPSTADIEAQLVSAARSISADTPMMVDSTTRLDSAVAGPGLKFKYLYTLVEVDVTTLPVDAFNKKVVPRVIEQACANPQLNSAFEAGVEFSYAYEDRNGKPVGTLKVDKKICVVSNFVFTK